MKIIQLACIFLFGFTTGCVTNTNPADSITVIHEDDGRPLDNLDYGIPYADIVLDRVGFANGYSLSKKQPLWVSYRLTSDEVTNKVIKRPANGFKQDMFLGHVSPTPNDYLKTGYDRGHIAPAADMAWSTNAMMNSFFMSNMSPQAPQFNRGIWSKLEEFVRLSVPSNGSIFVYSGPVFTMSTNRVVMSDEEVEVPVAYFKVLLNESEPRTMIGFVLNNEKSSENLQTFIKTVDQVEDLTGLDFFSSLPDNVEEELERNVVTNRWF